MRPRSAKPDEDFVKVVVRVRPPSEQCQVPGGSTCAEALDDKILAIGEKRWGFDSVLGPGTTQDCVFSEIAKPIVDRCHEGYNGTIFAYGQTGSGKTYTMMGSGGSLSEAGGIVPRSLCYLFSLLDRQSNENGENVEVLCKCSFIEIYQENLWDLLAPGPQPLQLRESLDSGVYAAGAQERSVTDANDALELMEEGWKNRSVAETAMNRESSRSHAIFSVAVQILEKKGGVTNMKKSQLNFVDLAGSEKQSQSHSEGMRLKEASSINTSLLTLGRVITAIVAARFPPYRDSKLTFLLRDSLGGNSKTCVIATIHPQERFVAETKSTLHFASNVKKIRNKPVINEAVTGQNVTDLQREIVALKEELRNATNASVECSNGFCKRGTDPFVEAMQLHQRISVSNQFLKWKVKELSVKSKEQEAEIKTLRQIILQKEIQVAASDEILKNQEEPLLQIPLLESLKREISMWKTKCEERQKEESETAELRKWCQQMEEQLKALTRQCDGESLLDLLKTLKKKEGTKDTIMDWEKMDGMEERTELTANNCRLQRTLRDKEDEIRKLKADVGRAQEEAQHARDELYNKHRELESKMIEEGRQRQVVISQLQESTIQALTPPPRASKRNTRRTTMFTPKPDSGDENVNTTELSSTASSRLPPRAKKLRVADTPSGRSAEDGVAISEALSKELLEYQKTLASVEQEKSSLELGKLEQESALNQLKTKLVEAERLKGAAEDENQKLMSKLTQVEVDIASLQESYQEMEKEKQQWSDEATELKEKMKVEISKRRDLEERLHAQAKTLAESDAKLCRMQSQLEKERKKNTELFIENQELADEAARNKENQEFKENAETSNERNADRSKSDFATKLEELENEERTKQMVKMMAERDKEVDTLQTKIKNQTRLIENQKKELKEYKNQLDAEASANAKLAGQTNLKQRIKYVENLKSSLNKLQNERMEFGKLNCCPTGQKFWASCSKENIKKS